MGAGLAPGVSPDGAAKATVAAVRGELAYAASGEDHREGASGAALQPSAASAAAATAAAASAACPATPPALSCCVPPSGGKVAPGAGCWDGHDLLADRSAALLRQHWRRQIRKRLALQRRAAATRRSRRRPGPRSKPASSLAGKTAVSPAPAFVPKPIMKRGGKAAAAPLPKRRSAFGWVWRLLGTRPRVTFESTVKVSEYSRYLGGSDGVPSDGSLVALGLGRLVRTRKEALLSEPREQSSEIRWMPNDVRALVLQASMGKASFAKAWEKEEHAMKLLHERRRSSVDDEKDIALMPRSMAEATARALQVAAEIEQDKAAAKKAMALGALVSSAPIVTSKKRKSGSGKEYPGLGLKQDLKHRKAAQAMSDHMRSFALTSCKA